MASLGWRDLISDAGFVRARDRDEARRELHERLDMGAADRDVASARRDDGASRSGRPRTPPPTRKMLPLETTRRRGPGGQGPARRGARGAAPRRDGALKIRGDATRRATDEAGPRTRTASPSGPRRTSRPSQRRGASPAARAPAARRHSAPGGSLQRSSPSPRRRRRQGRASSCWARRGRGPTTPCPRLFRRHHLRLPSRAGRAGRAAASKAPLRPSRAVDAAVARWAAADPGGPSLLGRQIPSVDHRLRRAPETAASTGPSPRSGSTRYSEDAARTGPPPPRQRLEPPPEYAPLTTPLGPADATRVRARARTHARGRAWGRRGPRLGRRVGLRGPRRDARGRRRVLRRRRGRGDGPAPGAPAQDGTIEGRSIGAGAARGPVEKDEAARARRTARAGGRASMTRAWWRRSRSGPRPPRAVPGRRRVELHGRRTCRGTRGTSGLVRERGGALLLRP